ncbi:MAG: hypothetical protein M1282_16850 [Chloroflexi bacterium]|nr:hypothetical protein [Chloroflexota bacterium]
MRPRKKVWEKKRPIAVTIVAWGIVVLFLIRLYQVIEPLFRTKVFETGITSPLIVGMRFTPLGHDLFFSGVYLLLSLIGIVVLIGFLRMHRWAWVILMAWTGISLTIALISYFYSRPNYLVMASNVIIAFALNQADVLRIFRIRTDQGEQLD